MKFRPIARPKISSAYRELDAQLKPPGFVGHLRGENCAGPSHDAVCRGLQLVAKKDAEMPEMSGIRKRGKKIRGERQNADPLGFCCGTRLVFVCRNNQLVSLRGSAKRDQPGRFNGGIPGDPLVVEGQGVIKCPPCHRQ